MSAGLVVALVCGNAVWAAVALYYCVAAVNAMDWQTRHVIRWAFVGKGIGLCAQVLAAVDYVAHADPITWPWLLLLGVASANAGTAVLYLANQRDCVFAGCPGRKARS